MEEYRLNFPLRLILGDIKKTALALIGMIKYMQIKGTFNAAEAQVLNIMIASIVEKRDGFFCSDVNISNHILKDIDVTADDYDDAGEASEY